MIERLKIKSKLLIVNAISILVVVSCVGVYWIFDSYWKNKTYFEQRIESQVMLVASNISAAVLFEDVESTYNILSALSSDPAILSAKVVTAAKTLAAITFEDSVETENLEFLSKLFDHEHLCHFKLPILDSGESVALLTITAHDRELHKAFWRTVNTLGLSTIVALVLGGLLSSRIQVFVTRPLKALSRVAQKVMRTNNYSLRGERYYDDELGDLTDNFNAMLDIIERRDNELEAIVAERTHQLEQRNEQLLRQVQARQKSERSRRESELRFKQAFFKAPIGMALVNAEGQIFLRNQLFNQLVGAGLDDDLLLESICISASSDDLQKHFDSLRQNRADSCEFEIECKLKDDNFFAAIVSMAAIVDDEHCFLYAVLQMQDVTEERKFSEKLRYQADHDVLTGLPNRRFLRESLETLIEGRSPESGAKHALCMLDLDRFKSVNDACGHAAGDELLKLISSILLDKVHSDDVAARLGGDEFAILLYNCDVYQAQNVMEKIRLAVEGLEFKWGGIPFRIGVSIGVAPILEDDHDISQLLQKVDVACFAAKNAGRNRVYTVEYGDVGVIHRQGEMRWAQRLHEALECEQFVLFTQQVVPLQQPEQPERIEVLLRLRNSDDNSFIPPSAFLPAAERYGLSAKVDQWVVKKLADYLQQEHLLKDARSYWVNLSGQSLGDDHFLQFLEETIHGLDLPPGKLNFEITETVLIKDLTRVSSAMRRLQQSGCRFALDDFGSGISSFGYLKNLPVDCIKIDGMFVRDILKDDVDMIFVKSIIDIAKVMGIKTIAEFAESNETVEKLTELGADFAQGYIYGQPKELIFSV